MLHARDSNSGLDNEPHTPVMCGGDRGQSFSLHQFPVSPAKSFASGRRQFTPQPSRVNAFATSYQQPFFEGDPRDTVAQSTTVARRFDRPPELSLASVSSGTRTFGSISGAAGGGGSSPGNDDLSTPAFLHSTPPPFERPPETPEKKAMAGNRLRHNFYAATPERNVTPRAQAGSAPPLQSFSQQRQRAATQLATVPHTYAPNPNRNPFSPYRGFNIPVGTSAAAVGAGVGMGGAQGSGSGLGPVDDQPTVAHHTVVVFEQTIPAAALATPPRSLLSTPRSGFGVANPFSHAGATGAGVASLPLHTTGLNAGGGGGSSATRRLASFHSTSSHGSHGAATGLPPMPNHARGYSGNSSETPRGFGTYGFGYGGNGGGAHNSSAVGSDHHHLDDSGDLVLHRDVTEAFAGTTGNSTPRDFVAHDDNRIAFTAFRRGTMAPPVVNMLRFDTEEGEEYRDGIDLAPQPSAVLLADVEVDSVERLRLDSEDPYGGSGGGGGHHHHRDDGEAREEDDDDDEFRIAHDFTGGENYGPAADNDDETGIHGHHHGGGEMTLHDVIASRFQQKYDMTHFVPWLERRLPIPLHVDVNGTVWLATSMVDGLPYAVKEVPLSFNVADEVAALAMSVECEYIARYFTVTDTAQGDGGPMICRAIQTEYYANGSLSENWIARARQDLPAEALIKKALQHAMLALEHLHRAGFAHGNPTVLNVFVSAHGGFRLANFGACRRVVDPSTGRELGWPIDAIPSLYSPPEGSVGAANPFARDVYAFTSSLLHLLWRCMLTLRDERSKSSQLHSATARGSAAAADCSHDDLAGAMGEPAPCGATAVNYASVSSPEFQPSIEDIFDAATQLGYSYSDDMRAAFHWILTEAPTTEDILARFAPPPPFWARLHEAKERRKAELRKQIAAKKNALIVHAQQKSVAEANDAEASLHNSGATGHLQSAFVAPSSPRGINPFGSNATAFVRPRSFSATLDSLPPDGGQSPRHLSSRMLNHADMSTMSDGCHSTGGVSCEVRAGMERLVSVAVQKGHTSLLAMARESAMLLAEKLPNVGIPERPMLMPHGLLH